MSGLWAGTAAEPQTDVPPLRIEGISMTPPFRTPTALGLGRQAAQ
jgi:hypothetical protein